MTNIRKNRVYVHEVAVLAASRPKIITSWDIWDVYTTREEAEREFHRELKNRPSWVTSKFHRETNRIRKYVPEVNF
jgi:hypothetical protein